MSQYSYQPVAAGKTSNGLGIAGFVCSLVGLLFTGGLLSPIGLILSLVGLGREPRGFAIAGLVLGLLGMCGWGLIWLAFGVAILGAIGLVALAVVAEPQRAEVTVDMAMIAVAIETERDRTGVVPMGFDGLGLDRSLLVDPWGGPYQLVIDAGGREFDILSNGPDGLADTDDDISFSHLDDLWNSPGSVKITTTERGEGGVVQLNVGGRTLTITGGEDGGQVRLDTGERVIEIHGGEEGGNVDVTESPPPASENDSQPPTNAPPPRKAPPPGSNPS